MRKICPHIEGGWAGTIGSPPVVKLVNPSAEYVRQVRELVGRATLIVVRWVEGDQSLADPRGRAGRWLADHTADMLAMTASGTDAMVAFEGLNEIPDGQVTAMVAFERERLAGMRLLGLRAVVDNCATANRNEVWEQVRPLVAALGPDDLYGLHDYVAVGDDLDNPWYCARWRRTDVLDGVPKVITEFGVDYIADRARRGLWPGVAGWQRHYNREQYLALLRTADAFYGQFAEVRGVCVFTMGQFAAEWAPFDVASIWPTVVAEQEVCTDNGANIGTSGGRARGVSISPIPGARFSQQFGEHPEWYPGYNGHPGVDLAAPDGVGWREWHGTPVRATVAGTCYTIEDASGYGLYCYVMGPTCDELLAHLSGFAVANGQQVAVGDVVGYTGYTGNCKPTGGAGTHVHWGRRPSNPYRRDNGMKGYVDPLTT